MARIAEHTATATWALVVLAGALLTPAGAVNAPETPTPTFAKDVLPIFQRSCQLCHRPGTAAPMSLLTYEDARPWARAIKARTAARQMPPWHIDRSIGKYQDDLSLSDEEIRTIVNWADAGAPRGNPADAPPPRTFPSLDTWMTGEEPDLIVSMENGFTIPAEGPDFTPSETVDPKITEDRYIKWIQVIPTAYCCVHHSNVYAVLPEGEAAEADRVPAELRSAHDNDGQTHLIEYAMGNDGDLYPDGMTKVLKAGSKIRFSPHYHPYGKEVHDKEKIGIKFYPKGVVPKLIVTSHRLRTGSGNEWTMQRENLLHLALLAGNRLDISDFDAPELRLEKPIAARDIDTLSKLSIPPNTIARHERHVTMPRPALLVNFQPHTSSRTCTFEARGCYWKRSTLMAGAGRSPMPLITSRAGR